MGESSTFFCARLLRWFALLAIVLGVPSSAMADEGDVTTFKQVDRLVNEHFFSKEKLRSVRWNEIVAETTKALASLHDPRAATSAIQAAMHKLGTSHTQYIPRDDPRYWELASVFEGALTQVPGLCPRKASLPPVPVTWDHIGVTWKELAGHWFVAGVFAGGPAEQAGLLAGDEIVSAAGRSFNPVTSFQGRAGKSVPLSYRRNKDGAIAVATVKPLTETPLDAFLKGSQQSTRMIVRGDKRIGYFRIWAWAGEAAQQTVRDSIATLNQQQPTAFIMDLRGGLGGASPEYLSVLDHNVPSLEFVNRDGKHEVLDTEIRVPVVMLVDHWTRSGKEIIAYASKQHHLATLVGTTTEGAVSLGSPFCLDNGALLYLATEQAKVDGANLEGIGVTPDIDVPMDIPYAAGRDPQLEAGISYLSRRPK